MTNEIAKPATKQQLDALIGMCLENGIHDAAGLLQLASDTLSNVARANDKPVFCSCYEYIGDNPNCVIHGKSNDSDEFSDSDTQERNEIYMIGMGA